MLAQADDDGREFAIYYLSQKFQESEARYSVVERTCAALVWSTRKIRHYMLSSHVVVVSKRDLIRYLAEKPMLVGRLARWLILLSEFDLRYVVKKSVF